MPPERRGPGRPPKPPVAPPPNPFRTQRPIQAPAPIRKPAPAPKPAKRACPNKECSDPKIEDGICENCGTIVDDMNIVSEVQFGETSGGAAVVQGSFVGPESGGARGPAGLKGNSSDKDKTFENRRVMQQMASQLKNVPDAAVMSGMQIFKLASASNFIQGRRMDMVIAVCLYSACRKEKPCRVMLIDFADMLQVNVFKLGHTFKCLHQAITLAKDGIQPVLPEDLIYRFAQKLEFGPQLSRVAEDAVRMVKRMSMDWMVMGRRPSGVCGACLILAARMNNFRRTVTEVVYIVKVTTATIQKRLEEFKLTPSSSLTVDEFVNNEFLEQAHDPPSYYEKQEDFIKNKKTRKRRRHLELGEDEERGVEEDPSKRQKTADPPVELRRDADGFVIPPQPPQPQEIPIDPDLINTQAGTTYEQLVDDFGDIHDHISEDTQPAIKSQTRGPRYQNTPIYVPAEWGAAERQLEEEINEMINDPNTNAHAIHYAEAEKRTEAYMRYLEAQKDPSAPVINMDTHIGEDEFEDDPEVNNCLLTTADSAFKEKIWVNENRHWLRKQQIKEAALRQKANGPPKATRNRKKKPRIGEGQESPAATPEEAAIALQKRLGWSKKIDYDVYRRMFNKPGSGLGSAVTSRAGSVTGDSATESVAGSSVAGSVAGDGEIIEADEDQDERSSVGTPTHQPNFIDEESVATTSVRATSPAPSITETSVADHDDWRDTIRKPKETDEFGEIDDDDEIDPGMGDVEDFGDDDGGDGYGDDDFGDDDD